MTRRLNYKDQAELLSIILIDTSIIHDTLAVIANEVKQSSESKMHFV